MVGSAFNPKNLYAPYEPALENESVTINILEAYAESDSPADPWLGILVLIAAGKNGCETSQLIIVVIVPIGTELLKLLKVVQVADIVPLKTLGGIDSGVKV